jgi:hypothetical protein
MADDIETLEVARQKPPRAKVGALAGVPEGAIAGAGLGAVFGGPIGALIGAGVGILARRAKQSMLDAAAAEADTAYSLNTEIANSIDRASQLPNLSEVDREQLAAIDSQRRKLSVLSQHPDPNVRAKATEQLAMLSTAPWLEDVETRADALDDARRTARAAYGKEQVGQFNKYRDTTDKTRAEGNAILKLANELGSANPNVQARFKNFVGGSFNEEEIGLHIKALGLDTGDRVASGDEIVKAVTAVTSAVTDYSQKRAANIVADLKQKGYALNTSEDGSLYVDTEEVPIAQVAPEKREPGHEPKLEGTIARTLGVPEKYVDNPLQAAEDAGAAVREKALDTVREFREKRAQRRRAVNP